MKRSGSALFPALAALIALSAGSARAEDIKRCLRFSVDAEFNEGQSYSRDIGNGLAFHAEPTSGGWHYEIGRGGAAGADDHYIYDLTLPLHGRHVTDLDTSYDTPAQDAVSDEPLYFWFLAFPQDGDRAERGQQMVHWPKTDDEEQQGWTLLGSLPKGRGQLEMLKWRLVPGTAGPSKKGDPAQYGALQWLQFRLTLTVPVGYALPADANASPLPCPAEEKDWPFEAMAPAKG
jgi:hypothetical protein